MTGKARRIFRTPRRHDSMARTQRRADDGGADEAPCSGDQQFHPGMIRAFMRQAMKDSG
jgi:hypothetical protein